MGLDVGSVGSAPDRPPLLRLKEGKLLRLKEGQAAAGEREGTRHSSLFAGSARGDPRDGWEAIQGMVGSRTQSVKGPNLRPGTTHTASARPTHHQLEDAKDQQHGRQVLLAQYDHSQH